MTPLARKNLVRKNLLGMQAALEQVLLEVG